MFKVDLNCDMGESFGLYELGNDEELMQSITSANIACGFHAGDPHVMRKTVELAKKYDVGIGAHPGFPDLLGFGRRFMTCTPLEIKDYVMYQVGALREFSAAADVKIQHCKPHGALFMKAMEDKTIARAILEAIHAIDPNMVIFALSQSEVMEEAIKMGVPVAKEAYADREHTESGSILLTRTGAQINDYEEMAQRVVRMVKEGRVITHDGKDVSIKAETICIHGDTPGAPTLAKKVVEALKEGGVEIVPIKKII
ncbi:MULTISPECIES: LamB/YcsF family protein [Peribacillus]|uniref:LamB/YcsF family protein n=1 Tax=Peribacillus TaxID=2675229 RepID=UPI001913E988|nr:MULTISPECIES: 5-oxoprolinase subunit PxpA [unclassified Peribacillus]MBK5460167.1 LamB/YcsF family protein [Peribacillus sp. TH27]MBK5481981.1 LamB/YcsF family protein [Peribacillus sp. TH16]MBK5498356.1 LamB/YcsF family protein [Peribacillus sp. TH14]WMX56529.1 5-oxoprolinase subunit PxpA [Peribacillus sp. R9-11]